MEKDESHAEGSDAVEEMYCELCKTKGRSRAADGFCVDCVKYFCSNCLESHSDFLPTHILKDKASMPQDVCIKPCPNHEDEIIKFYCFQCDKFFCSLCKEKGHIACTTVSHLPEVVRGHDLKQQLDEVKEKLASNLKDVEKRECDVKLQSSVPSECATKAKTALQSKKMTVIQWLDKNVDNIEKVIEGIQSSDEKALNSECSALAKLKDIAITVKTDMDSMKLPTNQCELFMTLMETQRKQKQIEEKLKQAGQHRVTSYEFKPNTFLEKLLGDGILGELAKKEETTFTYNVANIRRFKGQIKSTRFWCQSLPWHIIIKKQSNAEFLSIYLECDGDTSSRRKFWSCCAEVEIRIIFREGEGYFCRQFQDRYCRNKNCIGFPEFISWNELLDPNKGFCKDDYITLQVHVVAW